MFKRIASILTAAAGLVEAEGRLARLYLMRMAVALAVIVLATVVLIAGVFAVLVGVAWYLVEPLGVAGAILTTGAGTTLCGMIAIWVAHRRVSRPASRRADSRELQTTRERDDCDERTQTAEFNGRRKPGARTAEMPRARVR